MGLDGKVEADRCLDSWSMQLVMVSEFSSGIFYISNRCAVFALTNLEDLFKRFFFLFLHFTIQRLGLWLSFCFYHRFEESCGKFSSSSAYSFERRENRKINKDGLIASFSRALRSRLIFKPIPLNMILRPSLS